MEEILRRRADSALYDDATGTGVISLCAATAAQDTGSARQALDLLYKAGEIARSNDKRRIVESDVHAAREKLEQSQIEQGIRELTRPAISHWSRRSTLR